MGGLFGIGFVIVEWFLQVGVLVVICGCDDECFVCVEVMLCGKYVDV